MSDFISKLGYGAIVAIIGIAVVFFGLIIIISMIYIISALLRKMSGEGKEAKKEVTPAPVVEAAPAPAPAAEVPAAAEENLVDDTQLIAVITAAIAAMDGGSKNFVIRSVRRVAGWKNAARAEQVYKY